MHYYIDGINFIIKSDESQHIFTKRVNYESYIREVITNDDYVYVDSINTKNLLHKYGIESEVADVTPYTKPILDKYLRKLEYNKKQQQYSAKSKAKQLQKKETHIYSQIVEGKYIFRFGKYKNEPSSEVPKDYINWFVNNIPVNNW